MVIVSTGAKSTVLDVKIKGLTDAVQARVLDSKLLTKQGILSAHTDFATQVCRMEVMKKATEENLREVIRHAGFDIAKNFNE